MAASTVAPLQACRLRPFRLERYFALHEFSGAELLCCSDSTPLTLAELLAMADADTRKLYDGIWLGYNDSGGMLPLREEVARLYAGVRADDVLTCVPQEGVLLAHSLLNPGDHCVVMAPGYQSLHGIAEALGCDVSPWLPASSADGTLRFDVADLQKLLRPGVTSMVLVNFPHNPTGYTPSREEFGKLVDVVRASGAILFSDEMYRFMDVDPSSACPSAVELYDRAVSLGGLSKSHSCPGLRCGWLVTRAPELRRRMAECKDFSTICGSTVSEALGVVALRAGPAIVARNRDVMMRNLSLLNSFFAKHAAVFEWSPPRAGTVGFPRLLTGETADAFCERVLAGCNVLLLPSSVFDFVPAGEQRLRIGFGRDSMPEVLAKLDAFLSGGAS